jgi:putative two-component system response regulator
VARQAQLSEGIINIILYHHEKYDGSGYSSGIQAKEIPLEARIVTIADGFDALTTDRPYQRGFSLTKTMNIMSSIKGNTFDPEILETFLELLREMEQQEEGCALKEKIHE